MGFQSRFIKNIFPMYRRRWLLRPPSTQQDQGRQPDPLFSIHGRNRVGPPLFRVEGRLRIPCTLAGVTIVRTLRLWSSSLSAKQTPKLVELKVEGRQSQVQSQIYVIHPIYVRHPLFPHATIQHRPVNTPQTACVNILLAPKCLPLSRIQRSKCNYHQLGLLPKKFPLQVREYRLISILHNVFQQALPCVLKFPYRLQVLPHPPKPQINNLNSTNHPLL